MHAWWDNGWHGWENLGKSGAPTEPEATVPILNDIHVFESDGGDALLHKWWIGGVRAPTSNGFETACTVFVESCRNFHYDGAGKKLYDGGWYVCGACIGLEFD
jgi:hypothetical protein